MSVIETEAQFQKRAIFDFYRENYNAKYPWYPERKNAAGQWFVCKKRYILMKPQESDEERLRKLPLKAACKCIWHPQSEYPIVPDALSENLYVDWYESKIWIKQWPGEKREMDKWELVVQTEQKENDGEVHVIIAGRSKHVIENIAKVWPECWQAQVAEFTPHETETLKGGEKGKRGERKKGRGKGKRPFVYPYMVPLLKGEPNQKHGQTNTDCELQKRSCDPNWDIDPTAKRLFSNPGGLQILNNIHKSPRV